MKPNHYLSRRQFLTSSGSGLVGLGLVGTVGNLSSYAADEIIISATVGKARIPIFLRGYSGEALEVLRFDLEIQGFEIVNDLAKADYELTGTDGGQLEGRLLDTRSKAELHASSYQGAAPARALAHRLTDDVVLKVTGTPGIARTKIAFKGGTGPTAEIYMADYDGANAFPVTADRKLVDSPAWVPGKRTLLYTSYLKGYPGIYLHDLSTGARKAFAEYDGINLGPAVSPDGKRVAMILNKDNAQAQGLYVCDIDGGNLQRLTTDRSSKSSPTWSPDGKTICFVSGIPADRYSPGLYTIPANGGERVRLRTPAGGTASEPDWSPDGKWIAFTLTPQASSRPSRICRLPAGGGETENLWWEEVADSMEHASWSPNSRTLILSRQMGDLKVLSLLDAETKVSKTLSISVKGCSEPAWAK